MTQTVSYINQNLAVLCLIAPKATRIAQLQLLTKYILLKLSLARSRELYAFGQIFSDHFPQTELNNSSPEYVSGISILSSPIWCSSIILWYLSIEIIKIRLKICAPTYWTQTDS